MSFHPPPLCLPLFSCFVILKQEMACAQAWWTLPSIMVPGKREKEKGSGSGVLFKVRGGRPIEILQKLSLSGPSCVLWMSKCKGHPPLSWKDLATYWYHWVTDSTRLYLLEAIGNPPIAQSRRAWLWIDIAAWSLCWARPLCLKVRLFKEFGSSNSLYF